MINLFYKELKLSINAFFYLLPVLLAALMFIPNWIFTILFMYFFWITVPQIFGHAIGQRDQSFTNMLPVTKKEVVQAKILAILFLEFLHLLTGFVFGIIHNSLYGQFNFFFDINWSFLGLMILMYAIFNAVFFPIYYKTGYFFGKANIYGVVITLLYGFIIEYSVIQFAWARDLFEGSMGSQFVVLVISVLLATLFSVWTMRISIKRYEGIA